MMHRRWVKHFQANPAPVRLAQASAGAREDGLPCFRAASGDVGYRVARER
jgi:hypothetical protein